MNGLFETLANVSDRLFDILANVINEDNLLLLAVLLIGSIFILIGIGIVEEINIGFVKLKKPQGKWHFQAALFIGSILVLSALASLLSPAPIAPNGRGEGQTPDETSSLLEDRFDDENKDSISSGIRSLFKARSNVDRDDGVKKYRASDFEGAISDFRNAVNANRNDPEVQIYLSNSKARRQYPNSKVVLAAVVPVEGQQSVAEAFLRGVADSQEDCNQGNERPLVILIANDEDKPSRAASIAKDLVEIDDIKGVIGHYSSSTTQRALREYEKSVLAVISPTSTSTELESDVFFRTTPNDRVSGIALAKHAISNLEVEKVGIFYNSKDPYSKSIEKAFQSAFEESGGEVEVIDIKRVSSDFDPEISISKLRQNSVDAIALFPNSQLLSVASRIIKANAKINGSDDDSKLKLLGGDTLYDADFLNASAEGMVIVVPWFAAKENTYARIAGKRWEGQINWITATSFDATQAFCRAIFLDSRAGKEPTREGILEALGSVIITGDGETSGNPAQGFSFDKGEVTRTPALVRIADSTQEREVNTPKGTNYGFTLVQ